MAGGDEPDYKIRIFEAALFAGRANLNPTVQMHHIKALEKGTVEYTLRRVDCKVFSIQRGAMSHTHKNVYLGVLLALESRVVLHRQRRIQWGLRQEPVPSKTQLEFSRIIHRRTGSPGETSPSLVSVIVAT